MFPWRPERRAPNRAKSEARRRRDLPLPHLLGAPGLREDLHGGAEDQRAPHLAMLAGDGRGADECWEGRGRGGEGRGGRKEHKTKNTFNNQGASFTFEQGPFGMAALAFTSCWPATVTGPQKPHDIHGIVAPNKTPWLLLRETWDRRTPVACEKGAVPSSRKALQH